MSNFWDLMWLLVTSFFMVIYLIIMFQVVVDIFRDHKLGGIAKALWIVALIFAPFLSVLAYLIVRGAGMSERQLTTLQHNREQAESYLRGMVQVKSPAEQIADAKALLDAGTISADEFAKLKAKALG
ncbi:MAG: SHOCT domain-containing protein [Halothiobacillaceae bacterium]